MSSHRGEDPNALILPLMGGSVTSIHPLMAWWAVLHTLSTISRYQPAEWGCHIDVDRSQHAVPVERLLTESIRILPQLVAESTGDPILSPSYHNARNGSKRPVLRMTASLYSD
ncbi:YaaC family protein [Kitasatospora misakiensis]|uniref:YaaC family protein n=1 Tax=Kitasatospora misakiensis TaxID=67330 RepID=A0ABW0XGB5_9ACTN